MVDEELERRKVLFCNCRLLALSVFWRVNAFLGSLTHVVSSRLNLTGRGYPIVWPYPYA